MLAWHPYKLDLARRSSETNRRASRLVHQPAVALTGDSTLSQLYTQLTQTPLGDHYSRIGQKQTFSTSRRRCHSQSAAQARRHSSSSEYCPPIIPANPADRPRLTVIKPRHGRPGSQIFPPVATIRFVLPEETPGRDAIARSRRRRRSHHAQNRYIIFMHVRGIDACLVCARARNLAVRTLHRKAEDDIMVSLSRAAL